MSKELCLVKKEFSTLDEQLGKLRNRGLRINNEKRVKRILERENYYNLINGYKDLFIDKPHDGSDERYLEGANFNELLALYLFDRELRSLFLRNILEIENNVKSVLAYDFSMKYGHDNYLKIANFNTEVKHWEKKSSAQKVGEVADLIANLNREVSNQLKKNSPMISHYVLNYGYVPLWVLVNTLSLGTVSIFYSYLTEKDQNDIGRHFRLKPDEMSKFLFVLSLYRNACAHDERLFSLKSRKKDMNPNSIKTNPLHNAMKIPIGADKNPVKGKNDLFAVVIIFKIMLSRKSFNRFYYLQKGLIENLSKELNTISIDKVLERMGFPENWMDIKGI